VLAGRALVVAKGRSRVSGVAFNLCVAVDAPGEGRAVSDSSSITWPTTTGTRVSAARASSPPPGDAVFREPAALADTHVYVENIAAWLAQRL
jgi:hypothetical protein